MIPLSLSSYDHDTKNCKVGGFLNLVSAAWINWFTAILFGVLLVLEILFMSETLYPRSLMLTHSTSPPDTAMSVSLEANKELPSPSQKPYTSSIPRTRTLPFFNLRPIPGLNHPYPWSALHRFLLTFRLPVIVLAVAGYSFTWYWWVLSIITMVPAAYASYTPLIQGLLFLGLLLGTVVSEVLMSGRMSDALMQVLSRRNGGVRVPEMRLWMAYPAVVLTAVGLVVWGVSVDREWHWMTGQVGLFLCMFSLFFIWLIQGGCGWMLTMYLQSPQGFRSGIPSQAHTSSTAIPCSHLVWWSFTRWC